MKKKTRPDIGSVQEEKTYSKRGDFERLKQRTAVAQEINNYANINV